MLQNYKVILFDFDDTLVSTREPIWAHHKHVAKKFYDIDLTDDILRKHYGEPFEEFIQNLYEHKDSAENMIKNYSESREEFPKVIYDDTLETLERLLKVGLQIGIITATTKEYLMLDLERLKFPYEQMFHLQGADETEFNKPDGRVFEPAFLKTAEMQVPKSQIVYIGDGMKDLLAAQDAGINFIGINREIETKKLFKEMDAKSVSSLNQLAMTN